MTTRVRFTASVIILSVALTLNSDSYGVTTLSENSQKRVQKLLMLARNLKKDGKISTAITNYQKVIGICPTNADAWLELGHLWYQKNDFNEALYAYRKALELLPDEPSIHYNIGLCLKKCENPTEAIIYFEDAIRLRSDYAPAYVNYHLLLKKQGKTREAFEVLQRGFSVLPKDALINHALGVCYREQDEFTKSIEHFRVAARQDPDNLVYLQELANTLSVVHQYEEALDLYRKIFEMDTGLYSVLYNIGYILKRQGHLNEAIQVYKKVLELSQDTIQAHFALGMAYLTRAASDDDWLQGWQEYEWRWAAYNEPKKQYGTQPFWEGEDIEGKTIFVMAEQGFGDTFQFVRYLKLLKERGAGRIIFLCQAPLKRFLQTACDYIDEVVTVGDSLPTFDYQVYLMSLPGIFKTVEQTIPTDIPYLKADAQLVQYWHDRLSGDKNIKIGLCWQGNANYSTQALRQVVAAKSMASHMLVSSLSKVPGCSLYSLQKMGGEEQLRELSGLDIHDFESELDTEHGRFMDTAAIIMDMDLIITVDTSIAHLAAALGVPTWILLPTPADWRWMLNRLDTPWYPLVKLFRQPAMGDWDGLLSNVQDALRQFINGPDATVPANQTESHDLLNVPTVEFLDQLTLLALQCEAKFPEQLLCNKEQDALLKHYQLKIEQYPELKGLTQGLYAANCYLVAAMNSLNTDIATMHGVAIEKQIADLNRAQKLKKLLKEKIVQIVE